MVADLTPVVAGRPPPTLPRVWAMTATELLAPRRFVAISVVIVPLLLLQARNSRDPMALPLGAMLCGAFLLMAPALGRYFLPLRGPRPIMAIGVLKYALAGAAAVYGIGRVIPNALRMGPTFLTSGQNLLASLVLFWVGGWGLARDIDLEQDSKENRARALALEREAEHAQLLALRSHLDPHFLFNTLNAIAEWCRQDGVVAEKAILRLSSILRTVMTGIRAMSWPLAKELELVDSLFEMHLIRDPGLFVYAREVPPDLPDLEVPPMLLLPMAENAMKHGPGAGRRGTVALRVRVDEETLTVEIENPGAYTGPRAGGSGLAIIEKRLALAYGKPATFSIRARGDRTIATVRTPLRLPENSR
jgi:hypothetical protein